MRCEFDISGGGQGIQYLPGAFSAAAAVAVTATLKIINRQVTRLAYTRGIVQWR